MTPIDTGDNDQVDGDLQETITELGNTQVVQDLKVAAPTMTEIKFLNEVYMDL